MTPDPYSIGKAAADAETARYNANPNGPRYETVYVGSNTFQSRPVAAPVAPAPIAAPPPMMAVPYNGPIPAGDSFAIDLPMETGSTARSEPLVAYESDPLFPGNRVNYATDPRTDVGRTGEGSGEDDGEPQKRRRRKKAVKKTRAKKSGSGKRGKKAALARRAPVKKQSRKRKA